MVLSWIDVFVFCHVLLRFDASVMVRPNVADCGGPQFCARFLLGSVFGFMLGFSFDLRVRNVSFAFLRIVGGHNFKQCMGNGAAPFSCRWNLCRS